MLWLCSKLALERSKNLPWGENYPEGEWTKKKSLEIISGGEWGLFPAAASLQMALIPPRQSDQAKKYFNPSHRVNFLTFEQPVDRGPAQQIHKLSIKRWNSLMEQFD